MTAKLADFSENKEQATEACERFERLCGTPRGYKRINLLMDLCAADGVNGNDPLDWDRLLAADDFNFLHDVGGISRHMNRDTGELTDCFVPRLRKRTSAAA
jgi:hypothetical protein